MKASKTKIEKFKLEILERCFDAEISNTLGQSISPLYQRKRNKAVVALLAEGLIEEAEQTLPGRFPVKIKGYVLTLAGNRAFCAMCDG